MHGQMQVADQLRNTGVDLNQPVGKLHRVRSGVAEAINAGNQRGVFDQQRQIRLIAIVGRAPVSIDVLAQQGNFAHSLRRQRRDFSQNRDQWPADLFATGIGHHAERAIFAASFHDRDEGGWAFGARFWQPVEFFDLRERNVDHRRLTCPDGVEHLRQPVQGLRTEHQVYLRRPFPQRRAFLTGDAAANADDQVGALGFQRLPDAEL